MGAKTQICPICSAEFKVSGSQKRRYCSRPCMSEGFKTQLKGTANPNYRHGPKDCEGCGKRLSRNTKGNCCQKCRDRSGENNPFFGKNHSQETRDRWSSIRSGGMYAGPNHYLYGKHHTLESKAALSKSRKEAWAVKSDAEKGKVLSNLRRGLETQLEKAGDTKPEREVAIALTEIGVSFSRNALLYEKFYVDFLLADGTIIEVFGDYWHANPAVFTEFNDHQIRQTKKDKSRLAYLRSCGRHVVVVWEAEIGDDLKLLLQKRINERPQVERNRSS